MSVTAGAKFEMILKRLEKEEKSREDVLVPLHSLQMDEFGILKSVDGRVFILGDNALGQMCALFKVPAHYVRRVIYEEEHPELIASHFNYYFKKMNPKYKLKFRMKNGYVIGIVSKRYVSFDNLLLLEIFYETIKKQSFELEVSDFYESDKNMNMRVVYPELSRDYGRAASGKKDIIHVGLDISNSETGHSSVSIQPVTYRLVCSNGMKAWVKSGDSFSQRHIHLKRDRILNELDYGIKSSLNQGQEMLIQLDVSRQSKVDDPLSKIEELGRKGDFSKIQIEEVQLKFDEEPQKTMYGVLNAFTAYARELESFETRIEVEKFAGRMLHMLKS